MLGPADMENGRRTALLPLTDAVVESQDVYVDVRVIQQVELRTVEGVLGHGFDNVGDQLVSDFKKFLINFFIFSCVIEPKI